MPAYSNVAMYVDFRAAIEIDTHSYCCMDLDFSIQDNSALSYENHEMRRIPQILTVFTNFD